MWQAEADTELTLSALPATAVGQILLEYGTAYISTIDVTHGPLDRRQIVRCKQNALKLNGGIWEHLSNILDERLRKLNVNKLQTLMPWQQQ